MTSDIGLGMADLFRDVNMESVTLELRTPQDWNRFNEIKDLAKQHEREETEFLHREEPLLLAEARKELIDKTGSLTLDHPSPFGTDRFNKDAIERQAYGKSIARDKLEGDVGQLIKKLQPSETPFAMVRIMFRQAWDMRTAQALETSASVKVQITGAEKQIEALLARIMDAESTTVIRAYESKIAEIEKNKLKLQDQMAYSNLPKGKFDEVLELSLQFIANPGKYWNQAKSLCAEPSLDWPLQSVHNTTVKQVLKHPKQPWYSRR